MILKYKKKFKKKIAINIFILKISSNNKIFYIDI